MTKYRLPPRKTLCNKKKVHNKLQTIRVISTINFLSLITTVYFSVTFRLLPFFEPSSALRELKNFVSKSRLL